MIRKLEKYEVLEEIGHGGMATVYRARDANLDRFVALKIMHPHLRGAREARTRFAREARSVARLRHENILEIFDYSGEESEESFIAAELLTGPTLRELVDRRGAVPAEVAAAIGVQLTRALGAAHRAGIVHRDVKPENALIHEDRVVKLTDFGIAQMVDSQSFTATGQILGSPGHMAPEQVEGSECDARSDLFSLGTVLYYLATGTLPFQGRNPHQVLKRIVDGDFIDPLRARPTMGARFASIIRRCLANAREDRYESAEALERDLLRFIAEIGISDANALLVRYLADPGSTQADLRARVVEHLTAAGEAAMRARDVRAALDHFDRVLAVDEGNRRVLTAVAKLGRRRRGQKVVLGLGVALASVGIVALAYAGMVSRPRDHGGPGIPPSVAAAPDASMPTPTSRRVRDAAAPVVDASVERDRGVARVPPRLAERSEERPRSDGARTVEFLPTLGVRNFTISVDGAAPRDFGPPPGIVRLDLPAGHHAFVYEGAEGCCLGRDELDLVSSDEPLRLPVRMSFRDARLHVVANTLADVQVEAGAAPGARGRTHGVFSVPMDALEETRRITVTAEGYEAYTDLVPLRAGKLSAVNVVLVETGAAAQ